MRKEKRRVGSGITRFTRTVVLTETPEEAAHELDRYFDSLQRPLETFARVALAAEDHAAQLRSTMPAEHRFKEREDEGWYSENIARRYRFAEQCAERGEVEMALFHAAHMGMLISEADLKFNFEPFFFELQRDRESRRRGGRATRKGSIEERQEAYQRHLKMIGKRVVAAEEAAKELNVSSSTIRAAVKKGAGASD